jgi:hypothetical protein
LRLESSFEAAALLLRISNSSPGYPSIAESVPIHALVDNANREGLIERRYEFPLIIPLLGQSAPYPGDWYLFEARVDFQLPPALTYAHLLAAPTFLPTEVGVAKGPALDQISVELNRYDGDEFANFGVRIGSGFQARLFVYATSALPLLLVLGAFVFLKPWRRRRPEVVTALAVGMLAALPIRQVTVPAEVRSITRVDLILGLALALSAAALMMAFAADREIPTQDERAD